MSDALVKLILLAKKDVKEGRVLTPKEALEKLRGSR